MSQKIAVAVIHGIGRQTVNFAARITEELDKRCRPITGDDVVIRPVHWAPVLQDKQDELWKRMAGAGRMDFPQLRLLLIDLFSDSIAYQIAPGDREVYNNVHARFAATLRQLAVEAGSTAPLCIVAHSLGTVIASNFIYDLQVDRERPIIHDEVRAQMSETPLETGETITLLYTLGSPLALWSLRYRDFGRPITIPDPCLTTHYPNLTGEWVNIYDKDDVIGFPLKTLNAEYDRVVARDVELNIGSVATSWNPASHLDYWTDQDAVQAMADGLVQTWQRLNAAD